MPTLRLKIDCDINPNDQDRARKVEEVYLKICSAISSVDTNLVAFDCSYSSETLIDWDEYMGHFTVLSG